jgi:hypothetical protein
MAEHGIDFERFRTLLSISCFLAMAAFTSSVRLRQRVSAGAGTPCLGVQQAHRADQIGDAFHGLAVMQMVGSCSIVFHRRNSWIRRSAGGW